MASSAVQSPRTGRRPSGQGRELTGAVPAAAIGQPGAQLDGLAIDAARLPGGADAALMVQEDPSTWTVFERAAATAGSERAGL